MNTTEVSAEAHPVWQVINLAIKRGQKKKKALRGTIGSILGSEVDGIHAGIGAIVDGIRQGDRSLLHRTLASDDPALANTVLSAHYIEKVWKHYEESGNSCPPFAANLTKAYGEVAGKRPAAGEPDIGNALGRLKEQRSQGYFPDEMFARAVHGELNIITDLLNISQIHFRESDLLATADDIDDARQKFNGLVWRSVPPFLHAASSLDLASFEKIKNEIALPDLTVHGKFQKKKEEFDHACFEIVPNKRQQMILNLRKKYTRCIRHCISSYGCPAKYAKSSMGDNIISALCKQVLGHWEQTALPALFKNATRDRISYTGIARYRDEVQKLRG